MEEKTNHKVNFPEKEEEIDLLNLAKIIWIKRKTIYLLVGIFFLFGVFFSFLQSPSQFQSETTFLLKSSGSGNGSGIGSLGGLAAFAGINLPSGGFSSGAEIPPSLYPKFISSIEFKKALIQAPITIEGETETVTYAYYYENMVKPSRSELIKTYTLGLPSILISMINPSVSNDTSKKVETQLLKISPSEKAHFERLDNQLKVDSKDGVMVLSFSMPEPLMSAQMTDFAFKLLQKEIINYKLGNLREELRFSESLYEEKKKEFEHIQNKVGYFKDRNQNVILSSEQNQMERLQAEYSLKLNVFTQVANSLESTKLQIARNTPIFSILDPVIIPDVLQSNKQIFIISISIILGIITSFVYIIGSRLINVVRDRWNNII